MYGLISRKKEITKLLTMKLTVTVLFFCMMMASCNDDIGLEPSEELFESSISGTVLNSVYEGVANSTVELYKDGEKLISTSTDVEGEFTMDIQLASGEYIVFAESEEFLAKMITVNITDGSKVSVELPLANGGEKLKGDDPLNENLARVTGRFVNPDGNRALGWVFFRDVNDESLLSDILVRSDRNGHFEAYLEYDKDYLLTMSENCEVEETYISDQEFPALKVGTEYTFEDFQSVHYYQDLHRIIGTYKNCTDGLIERGLLLLELEEEALQEFRIPIANGTAVFDDIFQCNSTFEDGQNYKVRSHDLSEGDLGIYSDRINVSFVDNTLDVDLPNACTPVKPSLSYVKNEGEEISTIEDLQASVSEQLLTLYTDAPLEASVVIDLSTDEVQVWYTGGEEGLIAERSEAPITVSPEVRFRSFSRGDGDIIEGTIDFYYLEESTNMTSRIRGEFKAILGN